MNVADLKAKHPMPWAWTMVGNQAFLRDARGMEVPMFLMLDFVVAVTQQAAKPVAAAQPT